MAPQTYRINAPRVVAEAIDGEVIVIDLDSGTYYNLRGAGARVWEALDAGADVDHCVALVERHYEAANGEIGPAVRSFVDALVEAELVAAEPGRSAPALAGPPPERRPFEAPVLTPYVELQNLIQLDPILEQDEQGWPVADEGS